jgi:hypothetical protein
MIVAGGLFGEPNDTIKFILMKRSAEPSPVELDNSILVFRGMTEKHQLLKVALHILPNEIGLRVVQMSSFAFSLQPMGNGIIVLILLTTELRLSAEA